MVFKSRVPVAVLRIRDVYPGSLFLPIPDPGSRIQKQQQKRGVKNFFGHSGTCFCSHKFHKIENYFIFEMLKEKIWANFQRIIELFTNKVVTKLSKIWVWDPGSEIRDPRSGIRKKTYSGSRILGQKDTGFGIRNTVFLA